MRIQPADYADEPIVRYASEQLRFPLWPGQQALVGDVYRRGVRLASWRLGRRSGKTRMAAIIVCYESTAGAVGHVAAVAPGETVALVIVASSQRQARVTLRMVRAMLRRSPFARLIVRDTADELELAVEDGNGDRLESSVVIMAVPCSAATARGLATAVIVMDEAAWFVGSDGSPLDAAEVAAGLMPGMLQFPRGKAIVMSTPRFAASGYFFDLCRRSESGRHLPRLAGYHVPTSGMNPTIPLAELEADREADPEAFRREMLAEFVSGISTVFDSELVRAAVRDRGDLAPVEGTTYVVAVDAGFVRDSTSCIAAHRDPAGRLVVDLVREWRGTRANPVGIDALLDDVAAIAGAFNDATVVLDQFASQPLQQQLRARGVRVVEDAWTNETKQAAATELRRLLYAGKLDLPQHAGLIGQLSQLEQHALPSGRARIAAPGGQHDDHVSALMAIARRTARQRGVRMLGLDEAGRVTLSYVDQEEADHLQRRRAIVGDGESTIAEQRDAAWRLEQAQAKSRITGGPI